MGAVLKNGLKVSYCDKLLQNIFIRPSFIFVSSKIYICQLVVKEICTKTGNLPMEGLSRNSVADCSNMIQAITLDMKY